MQIEVYRIRRKWVEKDAKRKAAWPFLFSTNEQHLDFRCSYNNATSLKTFSIWTTSTNDTLRRFTTYTTNSFKDL